MNNDKIKKILSRLLIYFILVIISVVFLIPLYGVFSLSFKSQKEFATNPWGFPKTFRLDEYKNIFTDRFLPILPFILNSFSYTIPSMILGILLSALIAYPISRYNIKGHKIIYFFSIFGLTIPRTIIIIPVFMLMNWLGLYNTRIAVIWVYTALSIPFSTFVLRNFMVTIPKEIQESAQIDGSNVFGIFSKIILPLVMPAIAVLLILNFTWYYNEFYFGYFLTSGHELAPVQVGLTLIRGDHIVGFKWSKVAAASLVTSMPTLLLFLLTQRFFVRGISLGAVKG